MRSRPSARDTEREIQRERESGRVGCLPRVFAACRTVQAVLPLSLLRHSRAWWRKQDYRDADRRTETR